MRIKTFVNKKRIDYCVPRKAKDIRLTTNKINILDIL